MDWVFKKSCYGTRSLVVDIASARATGPAFESFFFCLFLFSRKIKWKCGGNCSKVDSPKMWTGKLEKTVFLAIFDNFGKYASYG